MSQFDNREKAFETRFAQDEELRFKVAVRRNRLIGEWAAAKLDLAGEEAVTYAKSVVAADFEKPGEEDVVAKLAKDLESKGVTVAEIRAQLTIKFDEAKRQLMAG